MRTLFRIGLVAWSAAFACSVAGAGEAAKAPVTASEKMAYALGVELASKFKKEDFAFDAEMAAQGLRDALAGRVQMNGEEVAAALKAFQTDLRRKISLNRHQSTQAHRERNDRFFAELRADPAVRVLPSGVMYRVLRDAQGSRPNEASTVSVAFRGTLLDGSEFDRTAEGQSAKLKLARMVNGWRIALAAMPVGARWQVWIPAPLAYGERGSGNIGPHEPLVLDLELLAIEPA